MLRRIYLLLRPMICLLFLTAGCRAQSSLLASAPTETKPHISKAWIVSSVVLLAASSLDASSSWGKYESNPFLRSDNGRFEARGVSIKLGIAGAMLAPQILLRKNHTATKLFTITNFAQAGMYTGISIRNYGIPRPMPGQPAR